VTLALRGFGERKDSVELKELAEVVESRRRAEAESNAGLS